MLLSMFGIVGGKTKRYSRVETDTNEYTQGYERETHYLCDLVHRDDGPAIVVRNPDTNEVVREEHWKNGVLHRDDGPAIEWLSECGDKEWYQDGKLHRDCDLPAVVRSDDSGDLNIHEAWYSRGVLHRVGAPASIWRDSDCKDHPIVHEAWYMDGFRHRDDGPAVSEFDPKSGIAVHEQWYWLDLVHRSDGPAIIERDSVSGEVLKSEYHDADTVVPETHYPP